MRVSRRRTATRSLTVLALASVALTGCGGGDGGQAGAAPSASGPAAASTPAAPATSADAARWAGSKQFVQIRAAWSSGGRTYGSIRTARKVAATGPIEAREIVPGEGAYTTVPLVGDARVLLSVPLGDNSQPLPYSQAELVRRITARSPPFRSGIGYDLSFDGQGRGDQAAIAVYVLNVHGSGGAGPDWAGQQVRGGAGGLLQRAP